MNIKHSYRVDKKIKKIKYYDSLVKLINQIDHFKKIESDYIRRSADYLFNQEIDFIKNKIQYKKNFFHIYENDKKNKEMSYQIPPLLNELSGINNYVEYCQNELYIAQNKYNAQLTTKTNLISKINEIQIRCDEISNEIIEKQNEISRLNRQIEEQNEKHQQAVEVLRNEHNRQVERRQNIIDQINENIHVRNVSNMAGAFAPVYHFGRFIKKKI